LAFLFFTPAAALATAAGAASIPIIIHLLNRRRYRVVPWAAMRFLLAAQKKNTRKMRLEQIILLAIRTLVILLLVLAMASVTDWADKLWSGIFPAGAAHAAAGSRRTHRILVLDGSFSMALNDGEQTCFDKAKAAAAEVLERSNSGDGFSVVLMTAPPRRIVAEPSDDAGQVANVIKDPNLRLPHGLADLPGTLNIVRDMLENSPRKFEEKEVYFLTDLQRATWLPRQGSELKEALQAIQAHARAIFVDVGRPTPPGNLAVTELQLGAPLVTTSGDAIIKAKIQNFGNEDRKQVRVELLVGKARANDSEPPFQFRLISQELVSIARGGSVQVPFDPPRPPRPPMFRTPGEYAIQVRVESDDLVVDDSRSAIVAVKDGLPVMVVDGKVAPEPRDRAAEYLRDALNPFRHGPVPRTVVARPRVVSESDFADAGAEKGELTNYDCVFLCDVKEVSDGEVRRLETHVRRGGGVVIFLGPQVDLKNYNDKLYRGGKGILPAELIGPSKKLPVEAYYGFKADGGFKDPPLAAFASPEDQDSLYRVRTQQYVRVRPAPDVRSELPHSKPRELLSFTYTDPTTPEKTADPAVIEWQVGRGKVVLVTTSANLDWTTWPGSPSYAAFLNETLFFACSGRIKAQSAVVGESLEAYVLTSGAPVDVNMQTPDPRDPPPPTVQTQVHDEEVSILRWSDTAVSGLYRATLGHHPQEYLFAVNVPTNTDESDLTRTSEKELHDAFPGWEFQYVSSLDQVSHTGGPTFRPSSDQPAQGVGRVVARWALFAMLGLLLVEVVLAWVFGHYSSVIDPTEGRPAGRGWLLPTAVGLVAAVVFAVLTFVLARDAVRNDFLDFLGDGVRGWIEARLGVPPPPSGESTRWHLEYASYFGTASTTRWMAGSLAVAAAVLVIGIYRLEGRTAGRLYRGLLAGLRIGLVLLTLVVLLPQLQLSFQRQSRPDLVLLIDVSGSMSARDRYQDTVVRDAAEALAQEAPRLAQEKERIAAKKKAQAEEKEHQALEQRDRDSAAFMTLSDEAAMLRQDADGLTEEAKQLREVAEGGQKARSPEMTRIWLTQALLTRQLDGQADWLQSLLDRRKVKIHIYLCAGRAARLKTVTEPAELVEARDVILGLRAKAENDTSQHGTSLRQVFTDFSGRPPAAVIMLSDGVTTYGEDLAKVARDLARVAREKKDSPTPLFLVGVGDAHDIRDLKLEGLQVEDTVYVKDNIVFQFYLTGEGYTDLEVPVTLREKGPDGKEKVLETKKVRVDPQGKPVRVEMRYRPMEPGEKTFVIDVPKQEDEADPDNNRLERSVFVREMKIIKVLYVEGSPRYDYRYIKNLLERESNQAKGNKSIDLRVLLLDADESYAKEDKSALNPPEFPNKGELNQYDVVILGDVDPRAPKIKDHLADLTEFVRERGGGLLMLAGQDFSPHAYKDTPLADVLPIEVTGPQPPEPENGYLEAYHLEVTPVGRSHPIFRFVPDEVQNASICGELTPMYWWSEGYRPKPLGEVLAVHPKRPAAEAPRSSTGEKKLHPLVVHQFVGAGRSMFFGFDESWRWRFRDGEVRFNQFWIQTVRYLARSRSGRVELRLDRQAPYRRGEPIKVLVRFPDDAPPPPAQTEVKVVSERTPPKGGAADTEVQTLHLAKLEGSRATYEGSLTRTPVGAYRFWLAAPLVPGSKPHAEAKVVPPEGEMDYLRMDQPVMKEAADATGGRFATLADADQMLDALPAGKRVVLNTPEPPRLVWNHFTVFGLAVLLVGMEWFLRKRRHLL
jgi:Mg-chelatase subunit ChlD